MAELSDLKQLVDELLGEDSPLVTKVRHKAFYDQMLLWLDERTRRRRIAIAMHTETVVIPIGEEMIITKATAKNVSKLEIKPNDESVVTWTEIALNVDVNIDISNTVTYDALIRITRTLTDSLSTIYLFTLTKE